MARRKNTLTTADIFANKVNLVPILREKTVDKIGRNAVEYFVRDLSSREEWTKKTEDNMKLALQISEEKSTPWPDAANIKHPMLTLSAIQFAARVSLFQGQDVAKAKVIGYDETGEKADRVIRIGKHMSYQLKDRMDGWEDDNDRMMHALPIIGCMYKKTYYCAVDKINKSELVYPRELVYDYYAKSVEKAQRKTHILWLTKNDIIERVRTGVFIDADLDSNEESITPFRTDLADNFEGLENDSENAPREFLEQHCFLDLDGDGYSEPYVATVDSATSTLCRLVPRYNQESITKTGSKISRIKPKEYFTQYSFIPDPNGGNLGIGFGHLQGPIVDVVNTLINQLLDAGTLSNMQSGFIGKGLRTKAGNLDFEPGEWKQVQATGEELSRNIVPLPVREPSNVLFMLLGMMVEGGERVGSITDAIVGDNPPANQPATTTLATIEQGMKVFKKIHMRLYRAFTREFRKLYDLNKEYLDDQEYFDVLDIPEHMMKKLMPITQELANKRGGMIVLKSDYKGDDTGVTPSADPNVMTEAERMQKVEVLFQTMQLGWNPEVIKKRFVEAMDLPNPDELMQPPPPPPEDPKIVIEKMRLEMQGQQLQLEASKFEAEMKLKQMEMQVEAKRLESEIEKTKIEGAMILTEMEKVKAESGTGDNSEEILMKYRIQLEQLEQDRHFKEEDLKIRKAELRIKRAEVRVKDKVANKPKEVKSA